MNKELKEVYNDGLKEYAKEILDGTRAKGFGWTQFLGNREFKIENVLNGGFSLRSKRFLEAPARFKIPYTIPAPTGIGKFPKVLTTSCGCATQG